MSIPEGRLTCGPGLDCPPGYTCAGGLCYSGDVSWFDGGTDAPGMDVPPRDVPSEVAADVRSEAAADVASDVPPDAPVETIVDVACGGRHSCALTSLGRVFCWGDNTVGQVGNGTRDTRPVTRAVAVVDLVGVTIDALALGDDFSCALDAGTAVYCWGNNNFGQLGDSAVAAGGSDSPHLIPLLAAPTAVTAGEDHACAIVAGNALRCWGRGNEGEVGDGGGPFSPPRTNPVTVTLTGDVVEVAAGWRHTCALLSDGAIWCWGSNGFRQLGNATAADARTPVLAADAPMGVDDLYAMATHTCVVLDGALSCWGANRNGELGRGATMPDSDPLPAAVVGLGVPVDRVAGGGVEFIGYGNGHTCAIVSGSAWCWGLNYSGQLGIGSSGSLMPTLVPTMLAPTGVTRIAAGPAHTCLVADAVASCFGDNTNGRLGDGTETLSAIPVAVVGLP